MPAKSTHEEDEQRPAKPQVAACELSVDGLDEDRVEGGGDEEQRQVEQREVEDEGSAWAARIAAQPLGQEEERHAEHHRRRV